MTARFPIRLCVLLLTCVGRATAENSVQLEPLADGPWKGSNTVFQAAAFDALLGPDRVLKVQPKLDGAPTGKPFSVEFSINENVDNQSFPLRLLSLEKKPAPSVLKPEGSGQKVEIAGTFEHRSRFAITYTFTPKTITVEGKFLGTAAKNSPVLVYVAAFERSHQFALGTPAAEIRQATEGHQLTLDTSAGPRSVPFSESAPTLPPDIQSAQVVGPWKGLKVHLRAPAQAPHLPLGYFHSYSTHALFEGGWHFGRSARQKLSGGKLLIEVE
jgi:hypothetical protein